MIDDALAPSAPEVWVFRPPQNSRILYRDSALVVVAIERPRLKLTPGELSLMHEKVKRVFVVISLLANGLKASDEV